MTGTPHGLAADVRARLAKAGNAKRAAGAQAYVKSTRPHYGVAVPEIREICEQVFDQHPLTTAAAWRQAIATLWDNATHQEERYAAVELAATARYQRFVSMALVPLYRRMIQDGAWWDTVDGLAHRVGVLLATYPEPLKRTLLAWAKQDNIWLRRVAIIAQVGAKDATDQQLLFDCIQPSLDSKEFFLRKAIGWALREYAKTHPAAVSHYLAQHKTDLSPLSRREAEKGLVLAKRKGVQPKRKGAAR